MSDDKPSGFECDRTVDTDGVVGARWWNQALLAAEKDTGRRNILKFLGIGGLTLATCAVCTDACDDEYSLFGGDDDYSYTRRRSLELQKQYGWDFGAPDVPLVFDGAVTSPFDPASVATLEQDLAPTAYAAFHVPTLLQSPLAVPTDRPAEETTPFEPLARKLRPVFTPAMEKAYKCGEALAAMLHAKQAPVAVLVDLPGPESVAFAAGAAAHFEPVFLLDNWPHPEGVVPSHLALAAAVYYQPAFVKQKAARPPGSPPLFVLDRTRLNAYVDTAGKFDNRYTARVPSLAALKSATGDKLKWMLYVVRSVADLPELEDLNEAFVAFAGASTPVRAITLDMFTPGPDGAFVYTSGAAPPDAGTAPAPAPVERFASDYPSDGAYLDSGVGGGSGGSDADARRTHGYHPSTRPTSFSTGSPVDFGTAPIVMAAATGAILGSRYDRRGSWNRTGG
ncbi:MAG: hypothetical protein JNL82_30790 [Myxococcales bacterium]|nr:hypothetical protein [Myxococcales bacterium]